MVAPSSQAFSGREHYTLVGRATLSPSPPTAGGLWPLARWVTALRAAVDAEGQSCEYAKK